MIEVEKDFILSDEEGARLKDGAKFLKEKINHDIYYDTAQYNWSRNDIWLRNRNGVWELKYPAGGASGVNANNTGQYHEMTDETGIANFLGLQMKGNLDKTLVTPDYLPYVNFKTKRTSYEKDGFHIDFDETDYGLKVTEIEVLVPEEAGMAEAERRIVEFAAKHGFKSEANYGKITIYLQKKKPELYQMLKDAGVF